MGRLEGVLGTSWEALGASWDPLDTPRRPQDASKALQGEKKKNRSPWQWLFWADLGEGLEDVLAHLGRLLVVLMGLKAYFGAS